MTKRDELVGLYAELCVALNLLSNVRRKVLMDKLPADLRKQVQDCFEVLFTFRDETARIWSEETE
jgi:hypothetical protein